jgi:hypothetical protein
LLLARKPSVTYSWHLSEKEREAELEVIAWDSLKKRKLCADSYAEQVWREVLSFEWKRIVDYKQVHDPLVKRVAKNALTGRYREFNPLVYRCAETYYLWFDPSTLLPSFQLVPVGPRVGRLQPYGRRECDQTLRRLGRATGSPFPVRIFGIMRRCPRLRSVNFARIFARSRR